MRGDMADATTYKPGPSIDEVLAKYAGDAPEPTEQAGTADTVEPDEAPAEPPPASEPEVSEDKVATDPAPVAAPAAPEMTPRERAAARRLEAQARELEQRERRWRDELEPTAKKIEEWRERVVDRPLEALREILVDALGVDEKAADAQIDAIIEDRTRQRLGLVADSEEASDSNTGSLERQVLQMRKRQRADEERKRREAEAAEQQRQIDEAVASLDERLMQAQQTYPWLTVQDDPGRIVLDLVIREQQRSGKELTFEAAAAMANDFYQEQEQRYFERRKSLFGQPQTPTKTASEKTSDERETATPRTQRPRSLTNAAAAAPATPTTDEMPTDPDAAKDWVLRKHLAGRLAKG